MTIRFVLPVFGVVLLCHTAQGQWQQTSMPQGVYIYSFAANGTHVFAGSDTDGWYGGGACVFVSTDNGLDWKNQSLGLEGDNVRALAINGPSVFAGVDISSRPGGVYRSTDNGNHWEAVNSGLTSLAILDLAVKGTSIFAATRSGGVFRSTNEGGNWTEASTGLPDATVWNLAVNGSSIFASTTAGPYRSTDDGASWTKLTGAPPVWKFAVSRSTVYALGSDAVFVSTDDGSSWSGHPFQFPNPPAMDIAVSNSHIFVLTNWGNIFRSTDSGVSWTLVNEGLIDTLIVTLGISDTYIFAGGASGDGAWRRALAEMTTSVERSNTDRIPTFALFQNYPNPFNPSTTIRYGLPQRSQVTLTIFNSLGQQVATLVQGEQDAGYHEVKCNGEGLSSGIYLYRLQAGDFAQTKSLLFLK